MPVRKTVRNTVTRTTAKTGYIVTLTVKNGLFKTKERAEQARSVLQSKNISVAAIKREGTGYQFTSKLAYGVPTVAIKERVIQKLRAHAASAGIPKSSVSITTKKL